MSDSAQHTATAEVTTICEVTGLGCRPAVAVTEAEWALWLESFPGIPAGDLVNDVDECPECGDELVVRHGKFGAFFGCSSYPDCRYTRKAGR